MASDLALVAIGAGASALTAAFTAGVPALLARRSEKERFAMETRRLDAEREASAEAARVAARERRNALMLEIARGITEQYGSMVGTNTSQSVGKLRAEIFLGSLELEGESASVCAEWLVEFDEQGFSATRHANYATRLVDSVRRTTGLG